MHGWGRSRGEGNGNPLQYSCLENPKEMAAHSSILAWKILWRVEPGGLQSRGLQSQTQLKVTEHEHWLFYLEP